jgi:ubiquinone biosynthesis monooxygenase Coq7
VDRTQRLVRRILRVNHAGEHGAISIYRAQIVRANARAPDLAPWLEDTLAHEQRHRAAFREAMLSRAARPCRAMGLWSLGGWLLGWGAALAGRTGILACTAAVERTVHAHMALQVAFLIEADPDLAVIVQDVLRDEVAHLAYAEDRLPSRAMTSAILRPLISAATEVLIALTTRGDSLGLMRELTEAQR